MGPSSDFSFSGNDRKDFCAGELRAGRADIWFDWEYGVQAYLLRNCLDLTLQPDVTIPADTQWTFALHKEDEALKANRSRAMVYLSAYSLDLQAIKARHFRTGEACSLSEQQTGGTKRVSFSSLGGVFLTTGIFFFSAVATAVWSRRQRRIRKIAMEEMSAIRKIAIARPQTRLVRAFHREGGRITWRSRSAGSSARPRAE